jgi:hypothetical protein
VIVSLVTSHLDEETGGGNLQRTLHLARAFQLKGFSVRIITFDVRLSPTLLERLRKSGVEVTLVHSLSDRFFIPSFSVFKLNKIIAESSIVHTIGYWSLLNVVASWFALKNKVKFVTSPAGTLPPVGRSIISKQIFHFLFGKLLLSKADRIIAITPKEANTFAQLNLPKEKIFLFPNAVFSDPMIATRDN